MPIDETDKRIISHLQGDLPLVSRPFAGLARELDISEAQVVERIRRLADGGVMRRFGATLRHQRSGFAANVMVVWRAPEERAHELGEKLSSFRWVSHCYLRETCGEFPYNLYTMVHGRSEDECRRQVEEMAKASGLAEYDLLFSREELKKTSMQYYND